MAISKRTLLLTSACAASLASLPATAQDADELGDVIVVEAQRRAENIQDVPIAINAFNQDQLQKEGLNDLQQVTDLVSSAQLFDTRGAGQPVWVIRGVGLDDFNSNQSPVTAVYFDDFYLTSNVMLGIGLFDVGGVEVLKGPQSGLYGRNTTGGAVRLTSVKPSLGEQSGYVQATYGSFDQYSFEGAGGIALSDQLAVRLAAKTVQGGGYQDSLATPGDDDHGDRDFWSVRGQVLYAPTDNAEFNLKVDVGEDNSETLLHRSTGASDIATGGFCAPVLAGMRDDAQCASFANVNNVLALAAPAGPLPSDQSDDGRVVLSNPINQLDNDWFGLTLRGDIDFGFATLTSVTGYIDFTNNQIFDFDATQSILFHEDGRANIKAWSQELYLTSNEEGPFTWLVGAQYAEDKIDEERFGSIDEAPLLPLPGNFRREFEQDTTAWAIYGQGEYVFNDLVSINGSIRYTDEDKELTGYTLDFPTLGVALLPPTDVTYNLDSHVTGHVGLDFKPTDNTLVYVKATRAYKSGGFFGGFAITADELAPFSEETVWAYEAGLKTNIPSADLTLNGAVFYYDYQDVQGQTQEIGAISGTVLSKLGNLGDAEHIGVEFEALWKPESLEGLSVQVSTTYLSAEITNTATTITTEEGNVLSIAGFDRINAPEWAVVAAVGYETEVTDRFTGSAQVSYNYRSDFSGTLPAGVNSAVFRQPSYDLLNANITLAETEGGWRLSLIGRNLLDEAYITRSAGDNLGSYRSLFGRPREFTAQIGYDF